MRHHHDHTTTIAILGADTLAEDILARLLEGAGYDARMLQDHPPSPAPEVA